MEMNIRMCDACGEEITKSSPRVSVEVRIKWDFKKSLDFHAKEECLLELPDIVKKLLKEGRKK